jgi:spermidine synthase
VEPASAPREEIGAPSAPRPLQSGGVYLLFLVSGMAALVYQVIWARWLGLTFGNTTTSVSIILGAFMLGLALGSWAAGRRLRRLASPMLAYAVLEVGIGAFALAFPLFAAGLDRVYTGLTTAESPGAVTIASRAALAFALLLVPTTLMGATLPLLTEFFRRAPGHDRSWRVGMLYAANTAGAALGVVMASFVGIELLGIRGTTLAAAALNFAVGAIGFRLSKRGAAADLAPPAPAPPGDPALARTVLLALTLSGGLALASEVLWTRTLQILIGNSTYAFATILVVYLVGVASGSAAFARVVKRSARLELWMVALLLGMGAWTVLASFAFELLQAHVAHYSRQLLTPSALLGIYLKVGTLLLPLALLSGALFPVGTRLLEPGAEDAGGELVARAYAWNTLGAVAGSILAGFVIAVYFDYFQALAVAAALYAAAAFAVAARVARRVEPRWAGVAGLLACLLLGGYCLAELRGPSRFVRQLESFRADWQVAYHSPGLQGVTTAIRRDGDPLASTLLVNAQGMTAKLTDTKMMAHLPLLAHPDPRETLVICFGMGTTFRSALTHGGRVTAVELVPEVFDAFDAFYADAAQVRADPNGRMRVNDGRNFLKLTRQRFDVITVDPPPPIDAAGVTNLYSREFVALARQRLAPGGIFAHWLPFPGTYSGVESVSTFKMLLKTVAAEFPHVMVAQAVNGVGLHVLASESPIRVDMERVAARLEDPQVAGDLREWQPVPLGYFAKLAPWTELSLPLVRGHRKLLITVSGIEAIPLLTDDRPRLEFDLWRSILRRQPKFYSGVWAS